MRYLVDTDWVIDAYVGTPTSMRMLDRFTTIPLSDPIMEIFARTRAQLGRTGQLIPDMDLLIAGTAIHHDLTLLTRNRRHFERIPDLTLYQPS